MLTFTASIADTLTPDLEIGSGAAGAEAAFGSIRDLEVGPEGSIYVLDGSLGTVRVFGPTGEYVRSVARLGEGPGELSRPTEMMLATDGTLWVYDDGARAIVVLAPDGTEIARHPSLPFRWRGGPVSSIWHSRFDGDGRLMQIAQHVDPLPSSSATASDVWETLGRLFLRSLDPTTGAADSVYLGVNPFRRYRYRDPMTGAPVLDFVEIDPRRLMALDGSGRIWTGLSTAYVLERRTAGDTLVVRMEGEAPPFGPEERSSWEGGTRSQLVGALPERGHALWRLFTDDENRIWVHRAQGFGWSGQFDVFHEDGQLLGSVALPGSQSPNPNATVVRNGYLYAVVFGELNTWMAIRAPLPTLP